MGILLAFAPFFVFVVVERPLGITAGLIGATITSAGLLIREAVGRSKTIKVLEVGTVLLFGGLAAYTLIMHASWSIPAVRGRRSVAASARIHRYSATVYAAVCAIWESGLDP